MTPRDRAETTPPAGTDADETQDAAVVEREAAEANDDAALAGAGLPQEGLSGGTSRPGSLAHRLYNGESGLDVVGRSRLIYQVTAVVVLLCLASMLVRGFNFGIDFAGGNSFRLPGDDAVLARFRSFGQSRFSGLGRVDRTLRTTGPRTPAERELVGAGSGRGTRGPQDRSRA